MYTYDLVGNRKTETTDVGVRHFVHVDNRLKAIRDGSPTGPDLATFAYDDNGALTEKRDAQANLTYTLTRDPRGQVAAVTGPGISQTFGYDPRGLRIRRSGAGGDELFLLEGEHLEAAYGAAGELQAKYLRGSLIDEIVSGYLFDAAGKATNYTYHHDQVNSVVGLTGHAGTVEETIAFAPFGEELSTTGGSANRLRFTGRERESDRARAPRGGLT